MKLTSTTKRIITVLMAVSIATSISLAQSHSVSGRISDTDGNPIIGVSVIVAGTDRGTSTLVDGEYSIGVSKGDVLQFECLGYKPRQEQVGNRSRIDVVLENDAQMIEDLVVVGYGTMRRSDVATSISSINTEEMKSYPAGNVAEMLRGKAPGIRVTSNSGRPGSVPSITIRGSRSISASNTPLYIIDGCVSSDTEFATVNANDIESIEILKDAAAQAIYGARASDGVILVTTRRGKSGKSEINYNGYIGFQKLWRNFDFFSGEEYFNMRREAKANDAGQVDASLLSVATTLSDDIMQEAYKNGTFVDWEDLMFDTAMYHNNEVSIRGGSDKIKVSASAGFFDQDGMVVVNSNYKKGNARINIDYQVNDWLKIGFNSSYGLTKQITENGAFYMFITRTPLAQVYDENGNYTKYINSSQDVNPLYSAQYDHRQTLSDNTRVNFFADARLPIKGLSYRLNTSYYNRNREVGRSRDAAYPGGGSTASLYNYTNTNYSIENILQYDVPIAANDHKLNLTFVQSIDSNNSKSLGYAVKNLPVDMDWNYLANGEITGQTRDYGQNNLLSYLLRLQYGYKGKYLMNLAVRRDGSSRFGADNKWGNFPSVALAWRISEEDFMKNNEAVDNLKFRVSYGIVGNQNGIGNYTTLGVSDARPGEFGDVYYMGYLPSSELSNTKLKWEQSATFNTGFDFGMWNSRITGSIEYYHTNTTNLLVNRSLNAALGYTSMLDNLGETETNGIDLGLGVDVIRKKNFTWRCDLNFSTFNNKIIKIDDKVDSEGKPLSQPGNAWIVGAPINIYYDYQFDGIYQYDDFDVSMSGGNYVYALKPSVDLDKDGVAETVLSRTDVVEPGKVKVKDVNNDGVIDQDDRIVIARDPDFTLSMSQSFAWRNLDLYMDLYWVQGGYILNPMIYDSEYGGGLRGRANGLKVDYWTPNNPSNTHPRPSFGSDIKYFQSAAYQDASYLRLRTLQLGYTIPQSLTKRLKVQKMRFYVAATNLLTFTNVLAYSPEVVGDNYPESQQFVFGINLSF